MGEVVVVFLFVFSDVGWEGLSRVGRGFSEDMVRSRLEGKLVFGSF